MIPMIREHEISRTPWSGKYAFTSTMINVSLVFEPSHMSLVSRYCLIQNHNFIHIELVLFLVFVDGYEKEWPVSYSSSFVFLHSISHFASHLTYMAFVPVRALDFTNDVRYFPQSAAISISGHSSQYSGIPFWCTFAFRVTSVGSCWFPFPV